MTDPIRTEGTIRRSLKGIAPVRKSIRALRRTPVYISDLRSRMQYGPGAPRFAELIWVDPRRVLANPFPKEPGYLKTDSGRVVTGVWPATEARPEEADDRIRECLDHWVRNMTWEETGRIDRWLEAIRREGSVYECRSLSEIQVRLNEWDRIFEEVRVDGRIRPRAEIEPLNFREVDGIGVHVGPGGKLYKGRGGHHRFAMALALDLAVIPARLGVVHVSAIPLLSELRSEPRPPVGSLGL